MPMNQETKAVLIRQLTELNLDKGFPYEDIDKIQESYQDKLADPHSQHDLTEDFNHFQMTIAGSVSYILAGKKIPMSQRKSLESSFFEEYPVYRFIEESNDQYPDFRKELETFETAREMIIRRTT